MLCGGSLGIGFQVMEKISKLRQKHIEASPQKIIKTFFWEDWNTVIVSCMCLALTTFLMYFGIAEMLRIPAAWADIFYFSLFVLGGYGGQRLVYKFLGTAESKLSKKLDENA